MDVRAFGSRTSVQKTLFSCASSDGEKVFGPGRPPRYPPDIRGISRPKALELGIGKFGADFLLCSFSPNEHWGSGWLRANGTPNMALRRLENPMSSLGQLHKRVCFQNQCLENNLTTRPARE